MRLYLYAIAEGLSSVGDVMGIQNEMLTLLPAGSASIVAGWVGDRPVLSRNTLEAQDGVVRVLHSRADALLPMRFGSSADSVEALARLVEPLAPRIAEACSLVRGREQMTVRVFRTRTEGASGAGGAEAAGAQGTLGAEGASGAGARYLAERAAKRIPTEVTPLLDALRDLQRATRIERGQHREVVATIYQLIDRGASAAYRERIKSIVDQLPELTARVSGPSPAYAFAALSAP
jgi:hypothetical protein